MYWRARLEHHEAEILRLYHAPAFSFAQLWAQAAELAWRMVDRETSTAAAG